jgi:hypothetical protein
MTGIIDAKSTGHPSARRAAGLALFSLLMLGTFVASAYAEGHRGGHGGRGGWGRGYYAPPVVYGSPYYYPPPVVYGPGIGVNIGIR